MASRFFWLGKLPIAFWLIALSFVLHQLLQYVIKIPLPFIDSYFDPFACAVLGLTVFLWERKYFWQSRQNRLGLGDTIIITIILAVISELLFPFLSDRFYRDVWDVLALFAGGTFFYLFINPPKNHSSIP